MDTYQKYDHTISEESLLQVLRGAASHGYQPLVMINGMYYNIALENIPSAPSADEELF